MAVLTRLEFAMENAIFFASLTLLPFLLTVINLLAPSPSATILFDKFNNTECKSLLIILFFYR